MEIRVIASKMPAQYKKELEDYLWGLLHKEVIQFDAGLDDLKNAPIAIRRLVGKLRRDRLKRRNEN